MPAAPCFKHCFLYSLHTLPVFAKPCVSQIPSQTLASKILCNISSLTTCDNMWTWHCHGENRSKQTVPAFPAAKLLSLLPSDVPMCISEEIFVQYCDSVGLSLCNLCCGFPWACAYTPTHGHTHTHIYSPLSCFLHLSLALSPTSTFNM